MKAKLISFLSILILAGLPASLTHAFEICKSEQGKKLHWPAKKMNYVINPEKGPANAIKYIKKGDKVWDKVNNSVFVFNYKGTTTNRKHGKNNGKNLVSFGKLDGSLLGVNQYWFYGSTGEIIDSDIRFNKSVNWVAADVIPLSAYDLQSVAAHEFGHSLCLLDLYDPAQQDRTMYGFTANGWTHQRSLHSDDKKGIRKLY